MRRWIPVCSRLQTVSVSRAPTARAKADKVRELRNAGVRPAEIARQVGISRTSVASTSSSGLSVRRDVACGKSKKVA